MTPNEPTVAVVMPVYEVAHLIDDALAAVAAQTRQPDEVIVVDDASSDGTADRARQWSDRLPLTIIERETNGGCGAARTLAIGVATADVIAPLDGDDIWLPHHLETTVPLAGPNTIVATKPIRWDGGDDRSDGRAWHDIPPEDEQADTILTKNFLFSGSLYWRTTLIDRAGGPSERRLAEDRDTWVRLICRAGCRAVAVEEATVLYRQRGDSLSADEGCLEGVVDILTEAMNDPTMAADPDVLNRALRRMRSRRQFIDALAMAEAGQSFQARYALVRAAADDRSFRGGMGVAEQGSVTLRALVALPSPSRAAARRRERRRAALSTTR